MSRKRLTNKQKDYVTLSTILALFALVVYFLIISLNYVIKFLVGVLF